MSKVDEAIKHLEAKQSVLVERFIYSATDGKAHEVSRMVNDLAMAAWEIGYLKGLELYGKGKNEDFANRIINKLKNK
jgi:hypothetical protein